MKKFDPTGKIGVNRIRKIILEDMNWIAREIFESDFGIDMEIEICDKGTPTGKLIACQIKSGASYFRVKKDKGIIFRGEEKHLRYWLNHSLPVILILHHPENETTIWQEVKPEFINKANKSWKILVPFENTFNAHSKKSLRLLNKKYPMYIQKFLKLELDLEIMKRLERGIHIVCELSEWVNKTIGRTDIVLKTIDEKTQNEKIIQSATYLFFYRNVDDLKILFPWAKFKMDSKYFEEEDENNYNDNYGVWDSEDGKYILHTITYEEYKSSLKGIRAINISGEVDFYRLKMKLNSLGKAYLKINSFLASDYNL